MPQTSWPAYFSNLTLSTVGGFCIQGVYGGAMAVSATVADEFLISRGYSAKHYLTSSALWSSLIAPIGQTLVGNFPEWSLPIYAASVATVGAFSYYGNDFLNYQEKIDEITSDLSPMIKLFDDENILTKKELFTVLNTIKNDPIQGFKLAAYDLTHVVNNKFILTTVATHILDLFNLSLNTACNKYIGNDGTTMLTLTLMAKDPSAKLPELAYKGVKVLSIMFFKILATTSISTINSYLNSNLREIIGIKSIEKMLLAEEHLNKILTMKNSLGITANLNNDLDTLLTIGQIKLKLITTNKMKELVALNEIMQIAPESLIIEQIKGFLKKKLTDYMYKKTTQYTDKSVELQSEKQSIISDLCNNFSSSVLTHSTKLTKIKLNNSTSNSKSIEDKKMLWGSLGTMSEGILDALSQLMDILYYGSKIISGQITVEQAPLMVTWLKDVSAMLQGGFKITFANGEEAQQRIFTILETINSKGKLDVAEHKLHVHNKIIIDNYCLMKGNKILINISYLELENKFYAISGDSGLGKTTFLKDIACCLADPFSSSGVIFLPGKNGVQVKTMFIDQKLYIPATATLFEAITLKSLNMIDEHSKMILQNQIVSLLDTLMSKNNQARNWSEEINNPKFNVNSLSGGESKKIGIVKVILEQPQILIMDEVFVGLDTDSLNIIQKLLKSKLHNTTVIVVDHKVSDNNHNNFYDAEIHLSYKDYTINYFSEQEIQLVGDLE